MNNNILEKLKEIDTSIVRRTLAFDLIPVKQQVSFDESYLVLAFILYLFNEYSNVDNSEIDTFSEELNLPENIDMVLHVNQEIWDFAKTYKCKFSKEELLATILFEDEETFMSKNNESTPDSILSLSKEVLDIHDSDSVLDFCSGKANFFVNIFDDCRNSDCTGIDIFYKPAQIAFMRAFILGENYNILIGNVMDYEYPSKYNKIFANYPFLLKDVFIAEYRKTISSDLGVSEEIFEKASMDWIFNAKIVSLLEDNGKAVALMTMGDTWNKNDSSARKYFVDNGLIESITVLPGSLFYMTNIQTILIVFSKGNESIKMIDASEIYTKTRRLNILTEQNIKDVLKAMNGEECEWLTIVSKDEIADNEYIINPTRYFGLSSLNIKNGQPLETVIKTITRGSQLKASDLDEMASNSPTNYQYLMLANIKDGMVNFDEGSQYLKEIPEKMDKHCIPNNAIVLAKIGAPSFKSAVVTVDEGKKILANGNLFVIEVDPEKANPYYIQAFFESEIGIAIFKNIYTGAVMKTISLESLRKMPIPVIPLEEQNVIAAKYLAAIDEYNLAKRKLQKAAEKMHHLMEEE